jgi:DNA-binding IclR family transcriptional regulator
LGNHYFVAEGIFRGAKVSISDIYLSLGVSKSTAIRCVAQLEDIGYLKKFGTRATDVAQ